jgi:hypothetical protein
MITKPAAKFPLIKIDRKQPVLVRLDILEAATAIPGKALNLMVGLWLMASISKSPTVSMTRGLMRRVNITRFGASDALRRLEQSGAVAVSRLPGRSARVTILQPGTRVPLHLENWR